MIEEPARRPVVWRTAVTTDASLPDDRLCSLIAMFPDAGAKGQ